MGRPSIDAGDDMAGSSLIALVTSAPARHLDEDLPPLIAALAARGVAVATPDWDDPTVDWASFDLAVVRSVWDYALRRDEFLDWADRVATVTRLDNPPAVLRWNTDKRYLDDLARAGVPVTPTEFIAPGEPMVLPDDGEFVVKPTVSAGSLDTDRYGSGDHAAADAHVARLQADGRTAMVQPYQAGVDEHGETGLVFMAGEFSHAFRKGAILVPGMQMVEGLYAEEDISPRVPSADELDVARRALAAVPGGPALLYARVDLVPDADGLPIVLELELAEPSLFLDTDPGAADRFAEALIEAAA
jgi:glutathione synthase/RimK-type ligase-like ATP-grasp enzyme